MPTDRFRIDTMTRADLDLVVTWAAQEDWNPGRYDAEAFFTTDPTGFLIGRLGDEPIASISVVRYGGSFGFLGLYIVRPEHRGKGYGLRIWKAGMAYLEGRTVGLDGVVAQQDNYRKSGFELAHVNLRYQGCGPGAGAHDPAIVSLELTRSAALERYDRPFFADDRSRFLGAWLALPKAIGLGIDHQGQLGGYGVIRPSETGFRIGPLFADSPDYAERLLAALVGRIPPGEPYFLDVPTPNPHAQELMRRHALTPIFETARMYRGPAPALPMERWYGVTSLELG